MAGQSQCENCGAVLLKEDLFCGECGAPRPAAAEGSAPAPPPVAADLPPSVPPPLAAAQAPSSTRSRWRVAFITLVMLGALTCLIALASFLLFGLTESDRFTTEENWLYATLCCLLPIGGIGALLAATGLGIWYTRLKKR